MLLKLMGMVIFWLLGAAGLALLWKRMRTAEASRQRLFETETSPARVRGTGGVQDLSPLGRWLYLAGFRSPSASAVFVAITLSAAGCGAGAALFLFLSGLQTTIAQGVEAIPGGVGQIFLPVTMLMPWLVAIMLGLAPWLYVRSARRNRVQRVEQDLPLALELLATLSEAGLGFDAALSRIMGTRLSDRPLADELQSFQADLLAGRPRVEALRRFSQRLNISTVSIFVSALAQAEQIGMGVSGVLRRQADDMRSRRRERANGFAAALPVKRMLPLVVCFLPGLFVWTLGPFFVQLFKIADTFVQVRSF
ncbi:type II secretion system F family protein [Lignipirellula cremea]|uniref:Bacterial type II secretion system protein F domain protein n=1 Tax=Lignipirellula cremea TaxID=2528010 RepID=A0A518E426_9BACT|nr:type II secretion system F family protein [Lignipirellula cremea]QDU98844.1 Bacterial type II secretion system protein F domain protein [Lignipirellula cremea]